jgi:hypothetical protein
MAALTPAQEEAYAYVRPTDLWLLGVIFEHPLLTEPLRFIEGVAENKSLPPDLNQAPVLFKATTFQFRAPAMAAKEGPGEGELQVDGVNGDIRKAARLVSADGNPVECTVLVFRIEIVGGVPDFDIVAPHQRYTGLRIEKIGFSATSATAALKVRDWGAITFPRVLFDRQKYPALHG